jgi:hypothetical protein
MSIPSRSRGRELVTWLESVRHRRRSTAGLMVSTVLLGGVTTWVPLGEVQRWALVSPLLPLLLLDLMGSDRRRALTHLLAWSVAVAILGFALGLCGVAPPLLGTDAGWLLDDTLGFVHRGEGVAVRVGDFGVDHALDYVYVSMGSALGGGLAPLLMGARHILWMAWQWGALVGLAHGNALAWITGLPPWSCAGAAGYAAVLVGWAEVTGAVVGARAIAWGALLRWVAAGTALLVLHLLLRLALVDPWAALLARAF